MGNLYWLGRYLERVKMTLDVYVDLYDRMLDNDADLSVEELCNRLSILDAYSDLDDFANRYLFDEDDTNSIISNLGRAFDNAIVLRDCIKSPTLAYVQLAYNTLQKGENSQSPMLEVQETLDYLYAFWGALGDYVTDVRMRNTVRTGASVERVDLALRLRLGPERVEQEIGRMVDRLYRSQLDFDSEAFRRIVDGVEDGSWKAHVSDLLSDVENFIYL